MSYISSRTIVQKIIRDYNIENLGWVDDADIWIEEALQEIGTNENKILRKSEFTVSNGSLNLPCDIEDILGIVQDGCFVRFQNRDGVNSFQMSGEFRPYINDGKIFFNKTGEIKGELYYTTFIKNCEGEIMLINHIKVTRAVTYYIVLMLMQKGMKHPVIDYQTAYNMWNDAAAKASNYCAYPAPYEIQNVLAEFINPIL